NGGSDERAGRAADRKPASFSAIGSRAARTLRREAREASLIRLRPAISVQLPGGVIDEATAPIGLGQVVRAARDLANGESLGDGDRADRSGGAHGAFDGDIDIPGIE